MNMLVNKNEPSSRINMGGKDSLDDLKRKIEVSRKGLAHLKADWASMSAIYPYAYELNETLTKEYDFKIALEKIQSNPFVVWLNDKNHNFFYAKKLIIEKGLIPNNDHQPITIEELRNKYTLEYFCSAVIRFLMDNENKLNQIPALKEHHNKIRKYMSFIKDELLKLGTIPFENEVWQNIFLMSMERLLKTDNRNVHSTGKFHEGIASELMCKKIMQLLYFKYLEQDLSNEFIITVAITTTAHFFTTTIDTKEAKTLVKKVKSDVNESRDLLMKTVHELLIEYATAQQISY